MEALIRFDGWDRPLAVHQAARIWAVEPGTEAVHWFSRERGIPTAAGREDPDRIENWRVQARLTALSQLQTLHLQRDAHSSVWHLLSATDEE